VKKSKSSVMEEERKDANRDPLTDEPGAHPVGVGVGAASGAATGAMIGAVGGPVGSVIGAAVGGVAGGLAGKAVGEGLNPTVEDEFWQSKYDSRPYVESGRSYEHDYRPAYRYGWESRARYPGRSFEEVESDLESGWSRAKGSSKLTWDKAKHATKDAWHRVERVMPGDFDKDGR
jgi:hypothetical protein